MSIGLLLARLIVGFGIAAHGSQKLFGWFGGYGPKGTGGWLESLGYFPGTTFAVGAALCELGAGVLIVLGFLNGIGPALLILVMLVAIFSVHVDKGFFNDKGGWELPSIYIAAALAFDFGGFGQYSLDYALGFTALGTVKMRWILIGVAIILAALNLAARRRAPQQTTSA